ncbi:DUF4443 domain-containing protein [Thermococcus sp.]
MSWKRGAYPEFNLEDALAVIFMLKNPIGRKAISEELGLGEGSVRTLLKKLSAIGIITSRQKGHFLNERGARLLENLQELFSEPIKAGTVEGMPAVAMKVKNPPEFKSIELRDEAIRFFARGAMILIVRNGEPVFPEDGRKLKETFPEIAQSIRSLAPEEGDLIVITWAEDDADALKSAIHVAVSLKENQLPEEIVNLTR